MFALLVLAAAPLVPAGTNIAQPVALPRDPSAASAQVRRGFALFTTRGTGNALMCSSCHLDAGQKELALPLAGVARAYPEYNKRAGRDFTLDDRITGCIERSLNARAEPENVAAIAAYLQFISEGIEATPWRKKNVVAERAVAELDAKRGEAGYRIHCAACHGQDGQGVQLERFKPGPLWGPQSFNDGAGLARVYTLAGFVRHAMPYWAPGMLDDATVLDIAYFIDTKPRPAFAKKALDYQKEPLPPDALYYRLQGHVDGGGFGDGQNGRIDGGAGHM